MQCEMSIFAFDAENGISSSSSHFYSSHARTICSTWKQLSACVCVFVCLYVCMIWRSCANDTEFFWQFMPHSCKWYQRMVIASSILFNLDQTEHKPDTFMSYVHICITNTHKFNFGLCLTCEAGMQKHQPYRIRVAYSKTLPDIKVMNFLDICFSYDLFHVPRTFFAVVVLAAVVVVFVICSISTFQSVSRDDNCYWLPQSVLLLWYIDSEQLAISYKE